MPFFFLCVCLHCRPLAFPSTFCWLFLLVWPKVNSIDLLPMMFPGLPHLSPAEVYLVFLVLFLLTTFGAQSSSVAPPFFSPPSAHSLYHASAHCAISSSFITSPWHKRPTIDNICQNQESHPGSQAFLQTPFIQCISATLSCPLSEPVSQFGRLYPM